MKRIIWKYPLKIAERQTVGIPVGWQFLSAQMQRTSSHMPETLTIWLSVDPSHEVEDVTLRVIGTGDPYDDGGLTHLATIQDRNWVWHLFREER